jgi:hypothetical protein
MFSRIPRLQLWGSSWKVKLSNIFRDIEDACCSNVTLKVTKYNKNDKPEAVLTRDGQLESSSS